jgi:hypothetical protein
MEVPGRRCQVCCTPEDTNIGRETDGFYHRLEERRKVKGAAYYERKKAARRQLAEAQKTAKVDGNVQSQLAEFGY